MQKNFGFLVFKCLAIYLDDEDGSDRKIQVIKKLFANKYKNG